MFSLMDVQTRLISQRASFLGDIKGKLSNQSSRHFRREMFAMESIRLHYLNLVNFYMLNCL